MGIHLRGCGAAGISVSADNSNSFKMCFAESSKRMNSQNGLFVCLAPAARGHSSAQRVDLVQTYNTSYRDMSSHAYAGAVLFCGDAMGLLESACGCVFSYTNTPMLQGSWCVTSNLINNMHAHS